jgi:hypothetical protein
MSISSVAQDSALRLGPTTAAPTAEALTEAAVNAVNKARDAGMSGAEAAEEGKQVVSDVQGRPAAVPAGPLSALVKWIPTETITLYVAIQAALGDITVPAGKEVSEADFTSRWVWLVIVLVVTVALTIALSYRAQKVAHPHVPFTWPVFDSAAAGAAFVVWGLSLPSTPLRAIQGYDYQAWNSVVLLVGTLAIATIAYAAGRTVAWEKVIESE